MFIHQSLMEHGGSLMPNPPTAQTNANPQWNANHSLDNHPVSRSQFKYLGPLISWDVKIVELFMGYRYLLWILIRYPCV